MAAGSVLPLLQSVIKVDSNGWSIDSATNSAGASLTHDKNNIPGLTLSAPSVGINGRPVANDTTALLNLSNGIPGTVAMVATPWPYFASGEWFAWNGTQGTLSEFVTGLQTASMPVTGTASYSSKGGVQGYALKSNNVAVLTGDASLTANFSTAKVSGTLTNMNSVDTNRASAAWNDVSLSGNIASGSANFTGTTTTTSAPGTAFAVKAGATGTVNGNFYGPNAEDVGAVWTIGDGATTAFGTVGGTQAAPSIGNPSAPGAGAPVDRLGPYYATTGGPTFDQTGSSWTAGNFRAVQTALQFAMAGVTGMPTPSNITIQIFCSTDCRSGPSSYSVLAASGVFLQVASNGNYSAPQSITHTYGDGSSDTLKTSGLSYVSFGFWDKTGMDFGAISNAGTYMFGFETPLSAMPTTGTAHYSGTGAVSGMAVVPGAPLALPALSGNAAFDANFSTGQVTGSFTGMKATAGLTTLPWNDVSVTASIAAGTNTFTGTTGAASAPANAYALKSTATGQVTGGFYGPAANEIGAVWTLSNGDGTGAAIGTVGGRRQ